MTSRWAWGSVFTLPGLGLCSFSFEAAGEPGQLYGEDGFPAVLEGSNKEGEQVRGLGKWGPTDVWVLGDFVTQLFCLEVLHLNLNLVLLSDKGGDKESVSSSPTPWRWNVLPPHPLCSSAASWSGLFKCLSFPTSWPFLFSPSSQVPLVLCFMSLANRGLQFPSSSVFT